MLKGCFREKDTITPTVEILNLKPKCLMNVFNTTLEKKRDSVYFET